MSTRKLLLNTFWEFFTKNSENIVDNTGIVNETTWDNLGKKLRKIDKNLCFEIDVSQPFKKQFIISADGIEEAFDCVDLVYLSKPVINGWEFVKFRQPLVNLEQNAICVDHEVEVSFADIQYYLDLKKENSVFVTILLFIPNYKQEDDAHETLKWLVLDSVLGEYDAVKKVDYCAAYSLDKSNHIPLKSIIYLKNELNEFYDNIAGREVKL